MGLLDRSKARRIVRMPNAAIPATPPPRNTVVEVFSHRCQFDRLAFLKPLSKGRRRSIQEPLAGTNHFRQIAPLKGVLSRAQPPRPKPVASGFPRAEKRMKPGSGGTLAPAASLHRTGRKVSISPPDQFFRPRFARTQAGDPDREPASRASRRAECRLSREL